SALCATFLRTRAKKLKMTNTIMVQKFLRGCGGAFSKKFPCAVPPSLPDKLKSKGTLESFLKKVFTKIRKL
ncbi:MAG: hypothetical protein IKV00_09645, partial [Clostridia bacterium]|nr:hypothetical protein [Clostridia bacterium]